MNETRQLELRKNKNPTCGRTGRSKNGLNVHGHGRKDAFERGL